ncbi:MAG: glutathione peroxidase [Pseudomonadota bacterium]
MSDFHTFQMTGIDGEEVDFAQFAGKRCLIVNVASQCGLTPQYQGLQQLHNEMGDDFVVLGFPCNQFGAQEPGSNEQICEFAQSRYDVTFPMFAKIEVNGPDTCELYQWLKAAEPGDIGWNFTKFLVGADGEVEARFNPQVRPEDLAAKL